MTVAQPAAADPSAPVLAASGLCCERDHRILFDGLDLVADGGQIVHIEGANGSGKTSLLRILCGLLLPQRGSVSWCGTDIRQCRYEYKADLLYIGHLAGLKDDLSAIENLAFFNTLNRFARPDLEAALDQVGLYGYEDVPVATLSAGQKRRVALARLWTTRARVWLLDEPLTAIDVDGVAHLQTRLDQHTTAGGVVLLTSHQALDLPGVTRLALNDQIHLDSPAVARDEI